MWLITLNDLIGLFQSATSAPDMEVAGLKERVMGLESNLVEKQNEILFLEEEVRSLRIKLTKRDAELAKQERELNKLRVTFLP